MWLGRFFILPLGEDKIEVATVYEQTGCLPHNEHRIPPMNGIGQERSAPEDAEIPKGQGNNTFLHVLALEPLDQEAHGKEGLTGKAYY